MGTALLMIVAAFTVLAGCATQEGAADTGVTAQQVVDELNRLYPLGGQRNNPQSCIASGCEELITTDVVSVHRMRDEATAVQFTRGLGSSVEQVGPFVLSYSGSTQQLTPEETRRAFAERIRALLTA
jgi:hypothetical protein